MSPSPLRGAFLATSEKFLPELAVRSGQQAAVNIFQSVVFAAIVCGPVGTMSGSLGPAPVGALAQDWLTKPGYPMVAARVADAINALAATGFVSQVIASFTKTIMAEIAVLKRIPSRSSVTFLMQACSVFNCAGVAAMPLMAELSLIRFSNSWLLGSIRLLRQH